MKKLTNLDGRIEVLDDRTNVDEKGLPTFRSLLRMILNNQVPKNAEESLDVNQILLKLRQVETELEFENAEFKLLYDKTGENQAKMLQQFHGQLLAYLKSCEKESEKK